MFGQGTSGALSVACCLVLMLVGDGRETCSSEKRPLVVQPDSQAFLSGIIGFSKPGEDGYGCGQPQENVMAAYEAIRWSLSRLNQDSGTNNGEDITESYIPGVKIGMYAEDSCSSGDIALRSVSDLYPQLYSRQTDCAQDANNQLALGVIGASESSVSEFLASQLTRYEVPQISYSSTASSLSSQDRYPYFMRTVPSDKLQAQVMLDVAVELGWTYVAVVYTEELYGQEGYSALRNAAANKGVCITTAVSVSASMSAQQDFQDIYNQLLQTTVTGVLYFGVSSVAQGILANGMTVTGAGRFQWIFSDSVGTSPSFVQSLNYGRGIITIAPATRHIAEFEDYWVRINETNPSDENPWFKDWYMTVNKCKLPGTDSAPYNAYKDCILKNETQKRKEYVQNQYVESAITSVFAYAKALKNAHADKCGSSNRGVCAGLLQMTSSQFFDNYLKPVDLTFTREERIPTLSSNQIEPYKAAKRVKFDENGDIMNPAYDVWSYNNFDGVFSFKKAGSHINGALDLNLNRLVFYDDARLYQIPQPSSACPGPDECTDCISGGATSSSYQYLDGDVIIGGVFSVHKEGGDPLTCGAISTSNVQLVEAFLYALDKISTLGILPGVNVGGLMLDDCSSDALAVNTISNFISGGSDLQTDSGDNIDTKNVQGFVAAGSDSTSVSLAEVFTDFQIPQMGYQAGASVLSDRDQFPYFTRSVSGDSALMSSVVSLLTKFSWTYVQVVHEMSYFGNDFVNNLKKTAASSDICLGSVYGVSDGTDYRDLAEQITSNQDARVVLVNIGSEQGRELLRAINSTQMGQDYVVIATQPWSSSRDITALLPYLKPKLVTIEVKSSSIQNFYNYLRSLTPLTAANNPWYREWYEASMGCYIDANDAKGYPQQCPNVASTPITSAPNITMNPYAVYVINAVYAVARGIDVTLKQYCGASYSGVCAQYRNAPDKANTLIQNIRNISFVDELGNTFKIGQDGSMAGFAIKFASNNAFGEVGSYNPEGESLDVDVSALNSIRYTSSRCPDSCNDCLYMYRIQPYMYQPGDVVLAGVFNVHNAGDGAFSCGSIRPSDGYLYTEALTYALSRINSGAAPVSLSNVKLGGLALDACESSLRASNLVSSLYSGAMLLGDMNKMVDVSSIHGWTTAGNDISVELFDVLSRLGVPFVSSSSSVTGPGAEFYRTEPTDDKLAQGILKLVKYMQWEYVQTVNSADLYGRNGVNLFKTLAQSDEVCILSSYEIGTHGTAQDIIKNLLTSTTKAVIVFANTDDLTDLMKARADLGSAAGTLVFITSTRWSDFSGMNDAAENTLSFSINSPTIDDFDSYMATKYLGKSSAESNPWFRQYYESAFQCDLGSSTTYQRQCTDPTSSPITAGRKYEQDAQVLQTVNAIYALTKAIDTTLKQVCGQNYDGVCYLFTSDPDIGSKVTANLADVTFVDPSGLDFQFENMMHSRGYNIHRFTNGMDTQVASFNGGSLRLSDLDLAEAYQSVSVTCGGGCLTCRYTDSTAEDFTYIPGDILLAGVFDVHTRGDNPFDCGDINTQQGFQLLEAFNYAIEYINDKNGIFAGKLQGVKLGGIGLDACKSSTRAGNLVANVHSGFLPLEFNGNRIDPERIDVYIGPYDSDMSTRVSEVLNVLAIPEISYGSTSVVFKDKNKYPYFLRTVPADDKLARAMVTFLQKESVNYVQVINSPGKYGDEAAAQFIGLATKKGICVAQNITLDTNGGLTAEDANTAVAALLRKPKATVVVTFINTDDIRTVLLSVKNTPGADIFKFLGSDTWSENVDLSDGIGETVSGAITLGVETSDLNNFEQYLLGKTPGNNLWFDEYYEEMYQCSLSPGSTKYASQCQQTDRSVVYAPTYRQDHYVLYTVNAVFAAAMGIHHALQVECGQNYLGLCEEFRNSGERRQTILDGIQRAKFEDDTEVEFSFTADGESNRGYHIFTVTEALVPGSYRYDNVGSYNDTHSLRIISALDLKWSSNCEDIGSCEECPARNSIKTRFVYQPSPENLNLISYFDVHDRDSVDPLVCGQLNLERGFPGVLAMFYALDQINSNIGIQLPPSIRLGAAIIDTCSNDIRVTQDTFSLLIGEGLCGGSSAPTTVDSSSVVLYMPSGPQNSEATASLLAARGVTTLNAGATSYGTGSRDYFLQTSSSSKQQAEALAAIANRFTWSYVSVIYTDSDAGMKAREAFLDVASASGLCVGKSVALPVNPTSSDAREAVYNINNVAGSNAVILLTDTEQTRAVLQGAQSLKLQDRFIWLGSDAWGTDPEVVRDLTSIARGAITVQAWTTQIPSFTSYVTSMTLADHGNIPDDWFEEFWQLSLKCRLENSTVPQEQFPRACRDSDRLTSDLVTQGPDILHTIIGAYVTAQGLYDIEVCKGSNLGLAGCLAQQPDRYDLIYNAIKEAEWSVLTGQIDAAIRFQFNAEGYGNTGYNVYNYRRAVFDDDDSYEYVLLGTWQGDLAIDHTAYYAYNIDGELTIYPSSKCPSRCSCENSDTNGNSDSSGSDGNGGGNTGELLETCAANIDMREYFYSTWGIVVTAVTAVGLICTICAFVYLLIFYPIRGGTTVLGYLLLFGVLIMYCLVFAFVLHADENICGIRRFGLGFVYAVCFSSMVIKVLNNWRVGSYYGDYAPPTYERVAHPCSLFWIAMFLIIVQSIIGIEWLVLEPPEVDCIFYQGRDIPRCEVSSEKLIISSIYVMMMILVTLIFSAVTWDSEENHRESRWILITACFTIGVWLVWTVIATMTEIKYREPAIAIALLVNASVILLCIFVRKIYLLVKYQREIEEERKSQYAASTSGTHDSDVVKENGFYSTLYPNQVFHINQGMDMTDPTQSDNGVVYLYSEGSTVDDHGDIEF